MCAAVAGFQHRSLNGQLHGHLFFHQNPHTEQGHQQQHQRRKAHDEFAGLPGHIDGGIDTHTGIDHQIGVVGVVVEHTPNPFVVFVHIERLAAARCEPGLDGPQPELLPNGCRREHNGQGHGAQNAHHRLGGIEDHAPGQQPHEPGHPEPNPPPGLPPQPRQGLGQRVVIVHHLGFPPDGIPVKDPGQGHPQGAHRRHDPTHHGVTLQKDRRRGQQTQDKGQ